MVANGNGNANGGIVPNPQGGAPQPYVPQLPPQPYTPAPIPQAQQAQPHTPPPPPYTPQPPPQVQAQPIAPTSLPAPAPAKPAGPPIDQTLEELWSVRIPGWIESWSPQTAQAMADGAWTAVIRRVAAFAPILAFVIGLLSRLIFRDLDEVYSQSLAFMVLLVAGATLSGPVGLGLFAGKLISYTLLAMPAVVLPLLVRQLTGAVQLRQISEARTRMAAQIGLQAVIAGALIYFWTQSMVILIRPLFSFVGVEPNFNTLDAIQGGAPWLVGAVMLATAAREFVVQMVLPKMPRAGVVTALERWRWSDEKKSVLDKLPEPVRVAIASTVLTIILAGTYESWFDLFISALVIGLIGAWRTNLLRQIPIPMQWAFRVRQFHPMLRLLAATLAGFLLTTFVVAPFWGASGGIRLLMIGSLLTLIIFNLLFPPLPVMEDRSGQVVGSR
ncbi:MAG: hypothetical protein ABIQ44_04990 [Chloroflexia bacterium]